MSAAMVAGQARARVDRIKTGVEVIWTLIVESYQARDWEALGYATWDEMCTREFGTSRLRLPREERAETVQSLREAGLSLRAIESATGHSRPTIIKDLRQSADQVVNPLPPESAPATGPVVDHQTGEILPELEHGESGSLDTYDCDRCGARFGICGQSTGSEDDVAADAYYASKVEFHASGQCAPAAEPVVQQPTVTGMDGKSYQRSASRKPPRKPLVDVAKSRGFALRQAMDSVLNLTEDDRYRTNEKQVADVLRGHLLYVAETVAAVLDQLP